MNTTARPAIAPQPQLPAALRIITAVAVAGFMAVVWTGAERASHSAVESATQAISAAPAHVNLQAVQVVGRRVQARVGTNTRSESS